MRLDLFLKKTHLVKHRTLAQELIASGQVWLNGCLAKSSKDCKVGDQLRICLPNKELLIEIVAFPKGNLSLGAGLAYYKILTEKPKNPASLD